jgi:hypothetical protein
MHGVLSIACPADVAATIEHRAASAFSPYTHAVVHGITVVYLLGARTRRFGGGAYALPPPASVRPSCRREVARTVPPYAVGLGLGNS